MASRLTRCCQRTFSSVAIRRSPRSYATSIADLNTLQSNAATINAIRASGTLNKDAIPEMRSWVKKAGVDMKEIDDLSIIHIAGTKGKGSTSAMVASILSKYRLAYGKSPRIGLYTSPHLKSVRERIQIDGAPIAEDEWTEYFYQVWDQLEAAGTAKPVYFRFLTILAFHTFVQECVDVVVLECGVGGEHDSTNIIGRPVVAGITSLGIDHVQVLGRTLESIAWHKSGIFKDGCPAVTVEQPAEAMRVLQERATEKQTKSFEIVARHPALADIELGLNGDFQKTNASLAIVLANEYLKTQGVDENLTTHLPDEFIAGLQTVHWPGRCERRTQGNVEWALDGAHTAESLALTGDWYRTIQEHNHAQCLIFNQQTRDATSLLEVLAETLRDTQFDRVIFCTNKTFQTSGYSPELTSINNASDTVESMAVQQSLAEKWLQLSGRAATVVMSIEEALDLVRERASQTPVQCLVTGSLHLVGGVTTVLDRDSAASAP